jgi:adenylylsulfate kinase-like enzyme
MKNLKKKGIWFYGLSGSGKSYASRIIFKNKKNPFLIDGDDVRKFISQDLNYSAQDRKVQIRRVFGITMVALKSNLFPVISTVYMDKFIAKNLKKNKIHLVKINRDLVKIMKKHKTYKNKKNVVGKDIKLDQINSTNIFNSGDKIFCKKVLKLIK